MSIKEFHDTVNQLLDKSQSGFFPPEEIDLMADRAQMSLFGTYYAEFLETSYVHTALNPFRAIKEYTSTDFSTGGYLNVPSGFIYPTALYVQGYDNVRQMPTFNGVKFYKDDELPDALRSQVRPVTATSPIAVQKDESQIRFYPNLTSYAGSLHYLRRPVAPKYNYDISGRNYIYKSSGSTDLEWQDPYVNAIILKTLEYLGVNLNNPEIVQYASAKNASVMGPDKP